MTATETRTLANAYEVELAAEGCDTGTVLVDGVTSAVVRRPDGSRLVLTHLPTQRQGE